MNTNTKRRVLAVAPVALAVVLSVAACGTPCMAGSNASGTPLSNTSSGTNGGTGYTASGFSGSSNSSGQSGVTGGTSGGTTAGSSGQSGLTSGVSAGSSGSTGQAGGTGGVTSGGSSGGSSAATGLSPDQVAQYCKAFGQILTPDWVGGTWSGETTKYEDLKKVTPVQFDPNIDVIISDGQAVANQNRVYAQVRDEIQANYKPLSDFSDQICKVH